MQINWLKNYNLLTFETVDSTNSEALRLANAGASGNFVVVSKTQTGGRGTKGRHWESIDGNLHMSILLDTTIPPKKHPQLSFVIANAIYETIAIFAKKHNLSPNIKLKWPNDVLIDGKKLAGILIESISFKDKYYIVIGCGINVMEAPSIDKPVTSLFDEGIILDSPEEFLNILMSRFEILYKKWHSDNNFIKTRKNWMQHAYRVNKMITVEDGVTSISGIFKEIDFTGALRLQLRNGQFHSIISGEVLIDE